MMYSALFRSSDRLNNIIQLKEKIKIKIEIRENQKRQGRRAQAMITMQNVEKKLQCLIKIPLIQLN